MAITRVDITSADLIGAVVWDVRDRQTYRAGHYGGAVNHPIETLSTALLATVDQATPIYVLCGGGTKAGKAVALLENLDATRQYIELKGGTRAAKAAGMCIMSLHRATKPDTP